MSSYLKSNQSKPNTVIIYFVALSLGLLSMLPQFAILQSIGLVIADIFIRLFKFVSVPLIALSIIVTLSQNLDKQLDKLWPRMIFYTLTTTMIAATVAGILYLIIAPSNVITTALGAAAAPTSVAQTGYTSYLLSLIPENIFSPFIEHQVMSALVLSIVLGITIRYIPDEQSRSVIGNFFKGIHAIFLIIVSWIVKIIPLAIFGFVATAIAQFKNGVNISGLGSYLLVIVIANLIQGAVVLPILLRLHKIKPFATFLGMLPALTMAFFTKSSVGTLPVTMATAERNLGIAPNTSRFVLPICTTCNMNGCAAFIFTTVIYLMQNHGIHISLPTMLLWVVIATITAVGNAGVPMGCFFLSTSLLVSMNVPITLMGLILPFYTVIDMLETALNVWSDSCVVTVIDDSLKKSAVGISSK